MSVLFKANIPWSSACSYANSIKPWIKMHCFSSQFPQCYIRIELHVQHRTWGRLQEKMQVFCLEKSVQLSTQENIFENRKCFGMTERTLKKNNIKVATRWHSVLFSWHYLLPLMTVHGLWRMFRPPTPTAVFRGKLRTAVAVWGPPDFSYITVTVSAGGKRWQIVTLKLFGVRRGYEVKTS